MCVEQQRQWERKALSSNIRREKLPSLRQGGGHRFKEKKGSEKIKVLCVNNPLKHISKTEIKCGKSLMTKR